MSATNNYETRDIEELDSVGGYYMRHVMAMTGERLDSKSKIAAELAFRDFTIDQLQAELDDLRARFEAAGYTAPTPDKE